MLNFGNSTTKFYLQVMAYERQKIDLEVEAATDQLFRAPELLDLYSDFPITDKIDVFSLGCVFYHLLFMKSAFNIDLKLDQMNSRYKLPPHQYNEQVIILLQRMLEANPVKRISCGEIWSMIDSIKDIKQTPSDSTLTSVVQSYCSVSD